MIKIETGGPAFPVNTSSAPDFDGMTLRDYFATSALQSVLDGSWPDLQLSPENGLSPIENSAVFSYQIVDAMIKARKLKARK